MTDTTPDGRPIEVVDVPEQSRFEARLDGEVVGQALYVAKPGRVLLTHTEVEPALQGQGIGQALASQVLDQLRAAGSQVVPQCPFIAAFIHRHPEYEDLVAPPTA
jgi:predicted GNAT family acetyltransferase